jgi:F-type H+-transporting ATPase subunit b
MNDILQQIGNLLLGSVPTILIFLFLVLAYRFLVYSPLTKVLALRRERTLGAIEKAQAAVAAADAKSQEYEARLRAARAEIFRAREQRLQQWNAEREKALAAARQVAQERVHSARTGIEAQASDARRHIEASADQLAVQILKAVLPSNFSQAEISR